MHDPWRPARATAHCACSAGLKPIASGRPVATLLGQLPAASPYRPYAERLQAHGLTNAQIAQALVVARSTVRAHTASLYRKLDAGNCTQAAARARALKLR